MLSNAQAKTVKKLRSMSLEVGSYFMPTDVFPCRDNEDNGHRRIVRHLADMGILGRTGYIPGELIFTQAALDAYNEWYAKRGFNVDMSEWRC